MKYTNEEIKRTLLDFIEETQQTELRHVIAFCLGYYGYITKQIWNQIVELLYKDMIK